MAKNDIKTIDIDGLVIEPQYSERKKIYDSGDLIAEGYEVTFPGYIAQEGHKVEKKTLSLVQLTKWKREYTKGSSDVILKKDAFMTVSRTAFDSMIKSLA